MMFIGEPEDELGTTYASVTHTHTHRGGETTVHWEDGAPSMQMVHQLVHRRWCTNWCTVYTIYIDAGIQMVPIYNTDGANGAPLIQMVHH